MISIIGIGGAGNQVANKAVEYGFHTGIINFSQRDLDSAENVKLKLKLVGSEGVGKNRDEAIRLLENNWELAVNFVKEHFSHPSTQVIVIVFSTGGGSGSGISPVLIDLLSNEMSDKTFVAMPIIPDTSEVLVNQMNCLSTFEQLSKLDISVFPIDNQKIKDSSDSIGKNRLYESVNKEVIETLHNIVSFTEKSSKNSNLDEKDLLQIFKTKGIGVISKTNVSTLNNGVLEVSSNSISEKIRKSWDNSVFAQIEYNQVLRAGVILDGQEKLMDYLDYENIFGGFSNGMPIDLFEGYYHESSDKVYSILTGLSWCYTRLRQIENIINEGRMSAEESIENTSKQEYKSKISSLKATMIGEKKQKRNVGDILSKYKR